MCEIMERIAAEEINMEKKKMQRIPLTKEQYGQFSEMEEKGIGNYIKMNREAGNYTQYEICNGICSEATLSRIELEEKLVDFRIIESLMDRLKLEKSECGFLLDAEDYYMEKDRKEIEIAFETRNFIQAEEKLIQYEKEQEKRQKKENEKTKEDNVEKLHKQFLYFWKGALERTKQQPDWEKIKELYTNALVLTAPDYQKKLEQKEILSNMEIRCIAEIIDCSRNISEKDFDRYNRRKVCYIKNTK